MRMPPKWHLTQSPCKIQADDASAVSRLIPTLPAKVALNWLQPAPQPCQLMPYQDVTKREREFSHALG